MPFEKGQSGNPKGRPKGSGDKRVAELRDWARSFAVANREQFEDDYKDLPPKDRAILYAQMLEFSLPKLARQEITDGDGNPVRLIMVRDDKQ